MTDEEGLLQAVVADPDDDTVRLAYADWLDENRCEYHAEFIRVQIELASRPCTRGMNVCTESMNAAQKCPNCMRSTNLRRREVELLGGPPLFRFDWYFGPKDAEGVTSATAVDEASIRWFNAGEDVVHGVLRRGFVEEVKAPVARFPGLVTDLLKKGFPIRKAAVTDRDPVWNSSIPGWLRFSPVLADYRLDVLPVHLYDRLTDGRLMLGGSMTGNNWRRYDSAEKARKALSDAIMTSAREGVKSK